MLQGDRAAGWQLETVALRVTSDPTSTVYDSVTLTPYNTNKNPAQSHPPAELWYDSVIVSKARIPDP